MSSNALMMADVNAFTTETYRHLESDDLRRRIPALDPRLFEQTAKARFPKPVPRT